jgi:hypothetical protein
MRTRFSILPLSTLRAGILVALGGVASVGFAIDAHAESNDEAVRSSVNPRPQRKIHLEDSDSDALFEVHDDSGHRFQCFGHCDLTAPEGRYHVRVMHGGSIDETDLLVTQPMTVRGRPSSYLGVGLGIPTIVGGVLTGLIGALQVSLAGVCDGCDRAQEQAAQAQASTDRRNGYLVVVGGALAVVGGIYLITTSHGSSLTAETNTEHTSTTSLAVAVVPNSAGASLSLVGRF